MHVLEVDSVRDVLRARTDAIHRRLEHVGLFEPILAGYATRPMVGQLLQAYHRFHAMARPCLAAGYQALAPFGLKPPPHDPLARLDADLQALGIHAPLPLSGAPDAPAVRAVGWVWVVEGSALGARIIDHALDRLFGSARAGRSFFAPPDDGLRWRQVCASMEDYGHHHDAIEHMAAGAQDAFVCIERSLLQAT